MPKYLIIFIITFIVLLVSIFTIILLEPVDHSPLYTYEEIKKYLKTGDIILFSCKMQKSFVEELIYACRTNLLNSNYGHAGIVIRENDSDEIYIVECCGYDQCGYVEAMHLNGQKLGGVRIIDLDTILKKYYDEYQGFYAVKFISEPIPNDLIMEKLKNYKSKIFQRRQTLILLAVTDVLISHQLANKISTKYNDDRMICTEFMYNLLQDCGVAKEYPAKLFWPHLITQKMFDDLVSNKYSEPFRFSINHDNI